MYLIIAVQWKYKGSIGGMAQRFVPISIELSSRGYNVKCLTTYSLVEHLGIDIEDPSLIIIDDRVSRWAEVFTKNLFILRMIGKNKIKGIHLAGGSNLFIPTIKLAKLKGLKISCTFASRTLDMASYDNIDAKNKWIKMLDFVDKIDVLNPSHDLIEWQDKISVSPCSFPSRLLSYNEKKISDKFNLAVFSGALVSTKNPLLACEVIKEAIASDILPSDFLLYIFGSGELKKQIEVLKEDNERYGFIIFGKQNEYFHILSKAKLFFSLQEYDNYPSQSLMEAMYFGCNCICTADGDTQKLFINTRNNIILDSRSPKFFAEEIRTIVFNEFNYTNYENISKNFTLSRFSDYFLNFLKIEE